MACTTVRLFIPIRKPSSRNASFRRTVSDVILTLLFRSALARAIASVSFIFDRLWFDSRKNSSGIFLFSGQKYGILETKIVLANLMRRFRFSVADSSQPMIIPSSEIVLKPKHGVPLIVSKRLIVNWFVQNSYLRSMSFLLPYTFITQCIYHSSFVENWFSFMSHVFIHKSALTQKSWC